MQRYYCVKSHVKVVGSYMYIYMGLTVADDTCTPHNIYIIYAYSTCTKCACQRNYAIAIYRYKLSKNFEVMADVTVMLYTPNITV